MINCILIMPIKFLFVVPVNRYKIRGLGANSVLVPKTKAVALTLSLPISNASHAIIRVRFLGMTAIVTLAATVSPSTTIHGQAPSSEILCFCIKVRPKLPTVVSEPKLLEFSLECSAYMISFAITQTELF